MAYDSQKAKKARLQRMNAESGSSSLNSCNDKPKESDNNNYNIVEGELQEEIKKKYTRKKYRSLSVARVMKGVAADIPEKAEFDIPMKHQFVRPRGYNHMISKVEPARHVEWEMEKAGPTTHKWWVDAAYATGCCGSYLKFEVQPDAYKLQMGNFCKNKFCPYCAWRRSLKVYGQMSKVMDYLTENPETKGLRYVFLTLTQRNCKADELPGVITRMIRAWQAIYRGGVLPGTWNSTKYSWLREKVIRGAFRALEVTVNQEQGTYHPHFHIVIAVPHNYFLRSNPWYMSHADWMTVWRCAMGLDYDPSVRIEAIKPDPERGYGKAVAEVSKYPIKDSDWMGMDIPLADSKEYLYTLATSLYNRRLLSWTGVFSKARQALGLTDPETDDNLADDGITTLRDDVRTVIRVYRWRVGTMIEGGYYRDRQAEADEERQRIAHGVDVFADDFDDGE